MPSNSRTQDAVEHAVFLGRAVTPSGGVAVRRIADDTDCDERSRPAARHSESSRPGDRVGAVVLVENSRLSIRRVYSL